MDAEERSKAWLDDQPQNKRPSIKNIAVGIVWAIPWIITVLTCLAAPDYLKAFWQHPAGAMISGTTFLWETACCALLLRFTNVALFILVILFAVVPAVMVPMLGPAVLTIFQALGPAAG